jgi:hypothetical protein
MGISRQRGFVTPRGKQWYGYFHKVVNDPVLNEEKIDRVTVILGLRSQMSKGDAREALQREITKQMGQAGLRQPDHERRFCDVCLVCQQPIYPIEGGCLERGDSEDQQTPYPV